MTISFHILQTDHLYYSNHSGINALITKIFISMIRRFRSWVVGKGEYARWGEIMGGMGHLCV